MLGAVGTALLAAQLSVDASYLTLALGLGLHGIGQGIAWTAMWIAAAEGVHAREQGVASGMASTALQVGGAVGLAALVAISNAGGDGPAGALRDELAAGLQDAAYLAAVGMVLGAAVAALRLRPTAGAAEQPLTARAS